jgi:hypothetical protein
MGAKRVKRGACRKGEDRGNAEERNRGEGGTGERVRERRGFGGGDLGRGARDVQPAR